MKKFILAALAIMTIGCTAQAQAYKNSRYYNQRTGHLDYSRRPGTGLYQSGENYYGLRIGPSFSTVSSDDKTLDGGNAQTGLNVGAVVGIALSDRAPVFFETGLYYTEKGGKKKDEGAAQGDKLLTTQYDGHFVEPVGLLKMDFLGLKTLTVEKECVKILGPNNPRVPDFLRGKDGCLDPDNIPADDRPLPVRIGRHEEAPDGASAGTTDGPRRHERLVPSGSDGVHSRLHRS